MQQAAIPMAMEGLLTVLKGTDLYYRMEREGRLRGDTTGNNLDTQLNFVPEMPEAVLKAGYTRVLNTIYDRRLANYFARCWTLLHNLDRSQAPRPMPTPLRLTEMMRFALASTKQLVSTQGPAYLQFLSRVITRHPGMLWEAFELAAKGYHLRKITEQVTAVDNFKQSLAHEMDNLKEEIARRAQEGNKHLKAYVREVVAQVQREYGMIHTDFRHDVDDALNAFVRALDTSLQALHLRMPMRFS
jgi:hypothetical protein